jgi:hypothetical protein
MVDLDAPIVPARSAAGISLGTPIQDVLRESHGMLSANLLLDALGRHTETRYHSPSVDLWEAGGRVRQIMVHGEYRGRLLECIKVGSTTADVERLIGPSDEDEEDNLIIIGVPGVCFEIATTYANPAWREAPITEIYVFAPSVPQS